MTTHKHMTESEVLMSAKVVIESFIRGETSITLAEVMADRVMNQGLCISDVVKILDKSNEVFKLTRLHNN